MMRETLTRRALLAGGAALSVAPIVMPLWASETRQKPKSRVIETAPFARLEEIGDGLFAVVSTPLGVDGRFAHIDTLCNGGLIVGEDKIVAVDGFYKPSGAAWLNDTCKRLFNRPISHVVCTHMHLDHTGGLAGFQDGAIGPDIIMTATTWGLMVEKYSRGRKIDTSPFLIPPAKLVGPTSVIADESAAIPLDLGGRTITIQPLAGHTASDLVILVDDAPVTFAGDLIWWGLFPNYSDAIPSALTASVQALAAGENRLVVPGHGGLVQSADLGPYVDVIASVQAAALAARDAGVSAKQAAKEYNLPETAKGWTYFNPRYPELALAAWMREWDRAKT